MRAFLPITSAVQVVILFAIAIRVSTVDAQSDEQAEVRERVIVLNSGRVMSGFATRNAGGWLVQQSTGRVQVPAEQVRVVGNSLLDTYRLQRDAVVEPTPAGHVVLAQWCISYRLHDEARDELRKCLQLDPDHSTARKLLRRLDDTLDVASTKPSPAESPLHRTADGFLTPDAESLGGLSTDSAVGFTQRIQPLLMNKCGNASCHGTTALEKELDGFHLLPVRLGANSHRRYTERNLAEVLRYVDLQQPSLSPLVTLPQGAHGGTSGVFLGAAGGTQLKMLRTWIKTVADEKRAEEAELTGRPQIADRPVTERRRPVADSADDEGSAARLLQTAGTGLPSDDPFASDPANSERSPRNAATVSAAPGELTVAQRTGHPIENSGNLQDTDATKSAIRPDDPFDPDIFNRRFHGRSTRSPTSERR